MAKKSAGVLREVWNGSSLCTSTAVPPSPPWLVSPTSLAMLECSDDAPLWISSRDGACFFDQLAVPAKVRNFLGYPYTTCRDLMDSDYGSMGNPDAGPLTRAELAAAMMPETYVAVHPSTRLYPLSACWPMGHSWSSMIAQHVMTSTCIEAGLESSRFLCDASGVSPASGPLVSVVADDVLLFERGAGGSFVTGSTAPLCEELDKVWKHHDIKGKSAKQSDRQPTGVALGLKLHILYQRRIASSRSLSV